MERLSDRREQLSSDDAELLSLLRAMGPLSSQPFAKRRALVRLRAQRSRRVRPWVRPLAIALVSAAGVASAAVLEREAIVSTLEAWLGGAEEGDADGSAPVVSSRRDSDAVVVQLSATPAPEEPEEKVEPQEVSGTPQVGPAPEAVEKPREPASMRRVSSRKSTGSAAPEDPSKLAAAVRALRSEGDPAKAQRLLDEYLRKNPGGALSEDALALSIEAASVRRDPRAADYARRYLARFPNGRYRQMARQVLSR